MLTLDNSAGSPAPLRHLLGFATRFGVQSELSQDIHTTAAERFYRTHLIKSIEHLSSRPKSPLATPSCPEVPVRDFEPGFRLHLLFRAGLDLYLLDVGAHLAIPWHAEGKALAKRRPFSRDSLEALTA